MKSENSYYNSYIAFNHYAKIKCILQSEPEKWFVSRIDEPTEAKNFKDELIRYYHYYRIYRVDGAPIPYCKFQKLDKLAQVLDLPTEALFDERA